MKFTRSLTPCQIPFSTKWKQQNQIIKEITDLKCSSSRSHTPSNPERQHMAVSASTSNSSLRNINDDENPHSDTKKYPHSSFFFQNPFIKLPVLFDMTKWRKEIKHITVINEEFQTTECWYVDVSQYITLSTKEPVYLPNLMDLSTPTQF